MDDGIYQEMTPLASKETIMKRLIYKMKVFVQPFLNWRFLVSYLIPWTITNGWAWLGTFLLPIIGTNWFTVASSAWLAFLWMPWTPEKILILPAALWLHGILFKNDPKTKAQLTKMKHAAQRELYLLQRRLKLWQKNSTR